MVLFALQYKLVQTLKSVAEPQNVTTLLYYNLLGSTFIYVVLFFAQGGENENSVSFRLPLGHYKVHYAFPTKMLHLNAPFFSH